MANKIQTKKRDAKNMEKQKIEEKLALVSPMIKQTPGQKQLSTAGQKLLDSIIRDKSS